MTHAKQVGGVGFIVPRDVYTAAVYSCAAVSADVGVRGGGWRWRGGPGRDSGEILVCRGGAGYSLVLNQNQILVQFQNADESIFRSLIHDPSDYTTHNNSRLQLYPITSQPLGWIGLTCTEQTFSTAAACVFRDNLAPSSRLSFLCWATTDNF